MTGRRDIDFEIPRYPVNPTYPLHRVPGDELAFFSEQVYLDNPLPSINLHGFHGGGDRFLVFGIYDTANNLRVGVVELEMRGNEPVALHDFLIEERHRLKGYGQKVIGGLLARHPGNPFLIVEIPEDGERFWKRIGTQIGFDRNGQIDWTTFAYLYPRCRGAGQSADGGIQPRGPHDEDAAQDADAEIGSGGETPTLAGYDVSEIR